MSQQGRRARLRRGRRSPRCRGAVLVLALFGALLIVGLIGYVFNTGRHAQLRQQTQSAADAIVISGAGYMARSFNTVAMNNVEISRLIAAVQLLDAVPQATQYAYEDTDALLIVLDNQLSRGTGDSVIDEKLMEIADDVREQHLQLEELDQFFNRGGYDVREMTFYDSGFGQGEIWKAMESLDAISTATMESLGELTQVTAIQTGRRNLTGGSDRLAAIAPFDAPILWQRSTFDDFREPVLEGRLPSQVDDQVTNRGPYDTIFGWHVYVRGDPTILDLGPTRRSTTTSSSAGSSSWSGGLGTRPSDGRRNRVIPGEVTGYRTFGTWDWLNDSLSRHTRTPSHPHPDSHFSSYVRRIAAHKINEVWSNSVNEQDIFDPEWVTDYGRARALINARDSRIRFTQWVRMDFETKYRDGVPLGPEEMVDWSIRREGLVTRPPGAKKLSSHVWEDEGQIVQNIEEVASDGQIIAYEEKTEFRWIFVWAGLDIGEPVEVRNPNNYASKDDLPVPLDFDHRAMERPIDGAPGYPGSKFAFLGLAQQPNEAPMWRRLYSTSAYDSHAAIAQASVFNNHSWDLWTQMWHAQLEPVQAYDQWVNLIQGQLGFASGYEDLSVGELEAMAEYLRSLEGLAPIMLTH